jgi:hypothetical protein
MYKYYKDINGQLYTNAIIRMSDGATVPFDPDNTDYQAYLKWLEDGNQPISADEPING